MELIRSSYYAATIYQQYIGLGALTARLLAAANGTEYFLASWVAVYTIEKFGRRSLMLFGAAGMAGSMAILAGMNYMSSVNSGGSAPGIVSAVFLFVFNTFFAVGWLGMTCEFSSYLFCTRGRRNCPSPCLEMFYNRGHSALKDPYLWSILE